MNELQNKQIIVFTMAYGTNIMYIIIMGIIGYFVEFENKDPETAILILLVGVVLSVIASTYSIRKMDIQEVKQEVLIRKLAITHVPALLALAGSMVYLFY